MAVRSKAAEEKPAAAPIAGVCQVCKCTNDEPCWDDHIGDSCAWIDTAQNMCTACLR